jgi:hypothetical protein
MEKLHEIKTLNETKISGAIKQFKIDFNDKSLPDSSETDVLVNSLGYLTGPAVQDANIKIKVSKEILSKISNWPAGMLWKYDWEKKDFELVQSPYLNDLRFARGMECFTVINRGQGWYLMLTEEQKAELLAWYQAWLDVTETQIIPPKPDWLK